MGSAKRRRVDLVSDTPPGSPTAGALWWNSVLGTMFIYFNDGNSSQWVVASPSAATASAQSDHGLACRSASIGVGTATIPLPWDVISYNSTGGTFGGANAEFAVPSGMGGTWAVVVSAQMGGSATAPSTLLQNGFGFINTSAPISPIGTVTVERAFQICRWRSHQVGGGVECCRSCSLWHEQQRAQWPGCT